MKDINLRWVGIFITILLPCLVRGNQWIVKYHDNSETSPQNFLLNKGEYSEVIIDISYTGNDLPEHEFGTLSLAKNSPFQMMPKHLTIDTILDRKYTVYIGTTCDSSLSFEDYEIPLDFIDANGDPSTLFKEKPIPVSLRNNISKITVTLLRDEIEKNSHSLYEVNNVFNVDDIEISFANLKGLNTKVNKMLLPSFNPSKRKGMKLLGTFASSYEQSWSAYGATAKINSKCFSFTNDVLSWKMKANLIPDFTTQMKESILNSINTDKPLTSKISFDLKVDIAPVLISCGISNYGKIKEMNQQYISYPDIDLSRSKDFNIYQVYHSSPGKAIISFEEVNRFSFGYLAKCYIETLHYDGTNISRKTMDITLDNAGEGDKVITLKPEAPFPTQCLTWNFETDFLTKSAKNDFNDRIVYHCRDYFSGKQSLSQRGCLVCETRESKFIDDSKRDIGMCIRSYSACTMNYSSDIKNDIKEYIKVIDTTVKLQKALEIVQLPLLSKLTLHSDDDVISRDVITGDFSHIELGNITIKIINDNQQDMQCFSMNLDKCKEVDPSVVTQGYFRDQPDIINLFPGTSSHDLFFEYPGYDNKTYNLMMMCYNFAEYKYHSYQIGPFELLKFIRAPPPQEQEPEPKHNCKKNWMNPQCINSDFPDIPTLRNEYRLLKNLEKEIDEFNQTPTNIRYVYLDILLGNLESSNSNMDILEKIITILAIYSNDDCNKHINYSFCRNHRLKNVKLLLRKFIFDLFPEKEVLSLLEKTGSYPAENVILFTTAMFYFSLIADAHIIETHHKLYNRNQFLIANQDRILEIINKQQILPDPLPEDDTNEINDELSDFKQNAKLDYINLLFVIQSNLIQINAFLEIDKVITKNKNHLTINQELQDYKTNIENLLPLLAELDIASIPYLYCKLYIFPIENLPKVNLYFDQNDITLTNLDNLKQIPKVSHIITYSMEKYPYVSIDSILYHPPSVSLRFYEKVGGKFEARKVEKLPMPIDVKVGMNKMKNEFTEVYVFNNDNMNFQVEYTKLKITNDGGIKYVHYDLAKGGDFVMGIKIDQNLLWLIIILSVTGVILIAGIGYFIYAYKKKKYLDNLDLQQVESAEPIMKS